MPNHSRSSSLPSPISMFSPSSSATAFSRSPSPPGSASLFSIPKLGFLSSRSSVDEEKLGAGLGDLSKRVVGGRKRRRRLGVQVMGMLVLMGVTVWWFGYGDAEGFARVWNGSNRVDVEVAQPGIIIGQGGTFPALQPTATSPSTFKPPYDTSPPTPIQTWGLDLSSSHLLAGIKPFPENPKPEENQLPLSPLGHFADDIYLLGPLTRNEYRETMMNFVEVAFPKSLVEGLTSGVKRYLDGEGDGVSWRGGEKKVWQTDKDDGLVGSDEVKSWKEGKAREEGWDWELMDDDDADKWVKANFAGSRIEEIWKALPSGILRSDAFRYLLLLVEGGIYSDTDTNLLRSPAHWGNHAKLFREGAGWAHETGLKRIADGEDMNAVLGEPSVVVGIEADVGDREDWFDWWPRPMQIVQWTMASTPHHPIALNAVLRILHATAKSVDWAHEHERNVKALKSLGSYKEMKALRETTVLDEPSMGGSVGVMAWTGPGVWTDAVLSYLRVKYGLLWTDLKDIREPLRVGDVMILPVTGFSPGVGNFGSQPPWHNQAMVEHKFRGSWKPKGDKRRRR